MKKPEWLKNLSEKATHGKAKYVTMLVPFIGEWTYSDFITDSRKARSVIALIGGTLRTGGLVSGVVTGQPIFYTPYWGPTVGYEAGYGLKNIFNHMDERNKKKEAKLKLQ